MMYFNAAQKDNSFPNFVIGSSVQQRGVHRRGISAVRPPLLQPRETPTRCRASCEDTAANGKKSRKEDKRAERLDLKHLQEI